MHHSIAVQNSIFLIFSLPTHPASHPPQPPTQPNLEKHAIE